MVRPETINSMTCSDDTANGPKNHIWFRPLRIETDCGFGEISSMNRFCTTMLTPKAVSNPVVVGA
jgi:hypothetical protein